MTPADVLRGHARAAALPNPDYNCLVRQAIKPRMSELTGDQLRIGHWIERINQRDLAAMSKTVQRVQAVVGDDNSSLQSLTEALQSDPALSAKILRVSNSPTYLTAPDPVTTVSRAATVIGFDAIRNICI